MMKHYLLELNTINSVQPISDMVQQEAYVVAMTGYPIQMKAVHKNTCIMKSLRIRNIERMCLVSKRYISDCRYLKGPEFHGTFKTFSGLVGNHDGRLPPDMLSADCEDINKGVLTGCRVSDPVPLRATSHNHFFPLNLGLSSSVVPSAYPRPVLIKIHGIYFSLRGFVFLQW